MANTQLTQKMKRHAVIVALKAEHSYLEISIFESRQIFRL